MVIYKQSKYLDCFGRIKRGNPYSSIWFLLRLRGRDMIAGVVLLLFKLVVVPVGVDIHILCLVDE